ncbi:hypothetical protein ATK30_0930 [Amycolatopsis echigonensis]|uniref:Uncharacterized protein n=1 Tax=Amycolatopsis echigonensis TaxID=2576905 RepID=A0A2N3W8K5_9PSEU|nr:hypothetical protein [Amycolatopsis niigatensis]PKV90191.1 hypothetical protein ATK30_0930 [Amycolatopsis niigatensis]
MVGRKTKREFGTFWSFLAFVAVVALWTIPALGPGVIAVLSAFVVLYCLFQAPTWCCASTRKNEFCRNNANGILLGCHIRQHKWQKLKMAFREQRAAEALRKMLSNISGVAASLSAVAGTISASAATVTLLVK